MQGLWKLVVHGSLETGTLVVLKTFHTLSVGLGEGVQTKDLLVSQAMGGGLYLVWASHVCLFYAYWSV